MGASEGRIALERGFVLHRKPYRDTSLLLEAFTAEHGRIGLVARGGRRAGSTLKGLLQPFQPLLLSWSGRGDLKSLTGAEPDGRPVFLSGAAVAGGFYLNEILLRLTQRHDPHPELFRVYARTVLALAEGAEMEWTLRLFERDLLDCLGYGLLLTDEAESGEPVKPDARYCYHLERGPLPGSSVGGIAVGGETLLALQNGTVPGPDGLAEAKRLMRAALRLYLGDKPLASRNLFRQLTVNRTSGE